MNCKRRRESNRRKVLVNVLLLRVFSIFILGSLLDIYFQEKIYFFCGKEFFSYTSSCTCCSKSRGYQGGQDGVGVFYFYYSMLYFWEIWNGHIQLASKFRVDVSVYIVGLVNYRATIDLYTLVYHILLPPYLNLRPSHSYKLRNNK